MKLTLQGGFAIALQDGNAEASFNALPVSQLKSRLPWQRRRLQDQRNSTGSRRNTRWVAPQSEATERSWWQFHCLANFRRPSISSGQPAALFRIARERRLVRALHGLLLLLTMIVLFVTTWLALFLSKLVTRPLPLWRRRPKRFLAGVSIIEST